MHFVIYFHQEPNWTWWGGWSRQIFTWCLRNIIKTTSSDAIFILNILGIEILAQKISQIWTYISQQFDENGKYVVCSKCTFKQKLKMKVGSCARLNFLSKFNFLCLVWFKEKILLIWKFIPEKIVFLGNLQKFVHTKLKFCKF